MVEWMHQRELWATYIRLAVHRSMFWRRREGDEEGGCRGGWARVEQRARLLCARVESTRLAPVARYNFRVGQWFGTRWRRPRALHHRWLGERRAMETVLCNNNWMAVSFHLLVSPSTWRSAKRTEEREREMGGSDERETTDYVTMEMIVARKEEDETLEKKVFLLSFVVLLPLCVSWERSFAIDHVPFFSTSVQLNPGNFHDNRLNDTFVFPFSSNDV